MKAENAKILNAIYEALGGVASEQGAEAFDHFYKGGGAKMFADLEKVLAEECGVKFVNPEYKAVPMKGGKWEGKWMIVDQTGAMTLTGIASKEEAERVIREVCNVA